MQNPEATGVDAGGAPTRIVEAIVASLVIVLGLVVLFGSRKLGSGWTSDGPGAGYFPFYIGLILCISGIGILYQTVLSKNHSTGTFVDGEQFRRVISVLVPAMVFVVVMQLIGIYVAAVIYIAVFMVWLGKYSPAKAIPLATAVMVFFYFLFEVWFKVPLYKGAFNPLTLVGL